MATLLKRGSKWYVSYRDATGRQRMQKGYTDKAETQRLANRLEDEKTRVQRGDLDPQHEARKVERARPVAVHVQAYRDHLTAKGSSGNHVSYTIGDIEKFITFSAVANATAITPKMLDQWVLTLRADDSARTSNRRVGSVQAFLRWLKQNGGVSEYVLEGYPKQQTKGTEKRKRRALSGEEATKLLANTPEERRIVYRFALLTGFRYGEVASMTPDNLNFPSRTVTVWANDAKNKNKHQTIPMHRDLIEPLAKLCDGRERTQKLFTMPSRGEAAKLVRSDCEAAKVDPTHVNFHALRHTFITRLAEALIHPKTLQELSRHSNIETTLNYYVHFKQDTERHAVDALVL